ncbi:sensor histidine kinase [Miniphocaeibacter halophilus]|uniref:Uncharacterized protein n=1 Tax=Miniphocaeibacter halophilus TaxID=2931922 RepID=A0AC61MQK4_9FIRM|nr:histidine kinase [Miniphocaeibacter halophilus]QQK07851.1 hypothetical protein JFY71_11330 [Miniphocaeibacter halophilus]
MNNYLSSFFIWCITTIYFLITFPLGNSIIPLISLGLLTCAYLLKNKKFKFLTMIIFIILIYIEIKFLYFVPILLYNLLNRDRIFNILILVFAILVVWNVFNKEQSLFIILNIFIAVLFKFKDMKIAYLDNKYRNFIIESNEKNFKLKTENQLLIEEQDKGISLAISKERNRIARDIHDGVGHIISRSILQVGALIVREEDNSRINNLNLLKDSLTESMEELRKSLHNLQEDSINLKNELEKIIQNYIFSDIIFNYNLNENKDLNFKYSIIYIVNECLNNIMKHSNATLVEINLRETANNIYILIKDNGTNQKIIKYGIGLNSIQTRVEAINGKLQVSNEKGFRVFINIEKEEI